MQDLKELLTAVAAEITSRCSGVTIRVVNVDSFEISRARYKDGELVDRASTVIHLQKISVHGDTLALAIDHTAELIAEVVQKLRGVRVDRPATICLKKHVKVEYKPKHVILHLSEGVAIHLPVES